eukprot:c28723_g1_i1 orf=67-3261(+)
MSGESDGCRQIAADTSSRRGEFLLQLLRTGSQGKDSLEAGENMAVGGVPVEEEEEEDGYIRDPAVAVLGPCHRVPQLGSSEFDNSRRIAGDHFLPPFSGFVWPPPSLPSVDFPFGSPGDAPYQASLDHALPSPLDPLFHPPANVGRSPPEHFRPRHSPIPRSLDGFLPFPDCNHSPGFSFPARGPSSHSASLQFYSPSGTSDPSESSEFVWSASLPRQQLPGEIDIWRGSESSLSNSTSQVRPAFPQLKANQVDLLQYRGNNTGSRLPCVGSEGILSDQSTLTSGDSLNGKAFGGFRDQHVKDHGPIGPPKYEAQPMEPNYIDGLKFYDEQNLIRVKGPVSKSGIWFQEVGTAEQRYAREHRSQEVKESLEQWPRGFTSTRSDVSSSTQKEQNQIMLLQRRDHREMDESMQQSHLKNTKSVHSDPRANQYAVHSTTEAANGPSADHIAFVQRFGKEHGHGIPLDTGMDSSLRGGERTSRVRAESKKKVTSKNPSGQWVAVSREREGNGVSKEGLEKVRKIELATCPDTEHLEGNLLCIMPEVTDLRPGHDAGARRGNAHEWKMKNPQAESPMQHLHRDATPNSSSGKHGQPENPRNSGSAISQLDHPGLQPRMHRSSVPGSAMELSQWDLHTVGRTEQHLARIDNAMLFEVHVDESSDHELGKEEEELLKGITEFLDFDNDDEIEQPSGTGNKLSTPHFRKDFDSETRQGRQCKIVFSTPMQAINKFHRRDFLYRADMEKFTDQLLDVFKSLIPREDEEIRRKQLLVSLENIVTQSWLGAQLFLFGSCANAFGVRNSDIDVCLSIPGEQSSKPELVTRLADILRSNKMQNVQALTHARVPIVKFTDPGTGISCDICVNNMLAVVNTKLLHDYGQIDCRLRQLAFMVKHWAKRRQVNETYRGTLSSYAYVLMCIHFLQQRRPAILPCLQEMEPTYKVTVGNIQCAYNNQVEGLKEFGLKNKETLGELVISFFDYWAFRHDYRHTVISVRTGSFLSKIEKDWTRRIGNERHLICIEDPFEITHDLGRVVDKHSICVLREEFQRAAKILHHDSTPCANLFEPYVREE